ncbi:hypothetical protein GE278_10710 [Enterobacteriaceae bacterium Kacie_13]|nr:hypothetical protein GE278_10710 [Enterobacteriaceae bacterium Kacie_13]
MNANITNPEESEPGKDDDFFELSHLFSVSELNYVDIARKEKIPQLMSRWPLLAELAKFDKQLPPDAEKK